MILKAGRLAKAGRATPLALSLQLAALGGLAAENAPLPSAASAAPDPFAYGQYEAALNAGVLFSPIGSAHNRPTINYTLTSAELGIMLNRPKGDGWWHGNFEALGEGFGSAIFDGPGNYIAGATLWLRYNFVPRKHPRLVPYVQGGGGITFTDIDRDFVGQAFNFNLDLGCGLRYFIADHWSLSLEYRYQHISNANLGQHNIGINSQGPILGVSYFF